MIDRFITVDDFEVAAAEVLPKMAYDYYRSGAEQEKTLKDNRSAFDRYKLWYRVLVDVENVDVSTDILGSRLRAPIIVAPTAYQKLAHPLGEAATAMGAASAGTIMVVSTLATTSLEDVASSSGGDKWFQLYVHKDRGLTKELVERSYAAGYRAIVLTVDAPVLGRRLADERNSFALPEGLSMKNLASSELINESQDGSALGAYVADRHDASLTWDDLDWVRSLSDLPLVLKGVVRPDDARRALKAGVDGIVVSNHGGRQLDGAPPSIVALDHIAQEVGDEVLLLMDGGIRSGIDVIKALALGARAVLVGRPVIWGLAVDGPDGVNAVLEMFTTELEAAMKLSGCARIVDIDRGLLKP